MGAPRVAGLLILTAMFVAACEQQNNAPTDPDISAKVTPPASPNACTFNTVTTLSKTEFGASSNEAKLAGDMKTAGAGTTTATRIGYQILGSIAGKYDGSQTSTSNASALTVALLQCMNIGGATVPAASTFSAALGPNGAFGVKSTNDVGPVTSHDDAWVLEPPGTGTWGSILPTGISTILAYGVPVTNDAFSPDAPLSGVFDWATLPQVTFGEPGVVVGQCTAESQYLQHNPAGAGAEVLGFVAPSCFSDGLAMERPASSLGARLIRFLSPTPAYAALATTTGSGGNKRTLSPFQVIGPSNVELAATGFSWKKSGNQVGKPFSQVQTPMYQIKTLGGTKWLQDLVLIWIEAEGNNGAFVDMCNNYAFTNAEGIAQFPAAYFNKAGGYTVVSKTTGTSSKPDVTGNDIPKIPPGQSVLSPLINVKNGNPGTCNTYHSGDETPAAPGPNGFKPVTP
jgi:hypothetical protein